MFLMNKKYRGGYFEGWYFKHQSEECTVAFIPARHIDEKGKRSASVQIVTDGMSACAQFPYEAFSVQKNGLRICIGDNRFSLQGIEVDLAAGKLHVQGDFTYRDITPPRYSIMGPFQFLPMQCMHSVLSMRHNVRGELRINGELKAFENGLGYIEGDCGSSFPERYLWTQCLTDFVRPASVMLSVADIPFAGFRFTGIIGYVYMGGKELRIATYLGASPVQIGRSSAVVRQGKWLLRVELIEEQSALLQAPVHGGMTRLIRESAACRVRYALHENGRTLFDFVSDKAGFECEYDGE